MLYLLGIFYIRKEIATLISILYTGNILATAFAGLIALGIFEKSELVGISHWQWLFIIQDAALSWSQFFLSQHFRTIRLSLVGWHWSCEFLPSREFPKTLSGARPAPLLSLV